MPLAPDRRELLKGLFAGIIIPTLPANLLAPYPSNSYDVVVYGGTVAGINAAYTAALMGCNVALVCADPALGGMSGIGGLTTIDMSYYANQIGGVFWQQIQTMNQIENMAPGNNGAVWPSLFKSFVASTNASASGYLAPSGLGPQNAASWQPQPNTIRSVLNMTALGLLAPNQPVTGKIAIFLNAPLATTAGSVYPSVKFASSAVSAPITSIVTAAGTFYGTAFVDASYEGDLLAATARNTGGLSYTFGRESTTAYTENKAGFGASSSVTQIASVAGAGTLPNAQIIANPGTATGAADNGIQPYTFRVPLQKVANGGRAFILPQGYDATQYKSFGQLMTRANRTTLATAITIYNSMGNGKYSTNDGTTLATLPQAHYSYPDGTPTQREAIKLQIARFSQGLFWYLQTSSEVPAALNTDTALYGLDTSAYPDLSYNGYPGWPYQLYIREGRRGDSLKSDAPGGFRGVAGKQTTLTQADVLLSANTYGNAIAKTCYIMDNHGGAFYAQDNNNYVDDGGFFDSAYGASFLPMGMLTADTTGCPNIAVPVCSGCTHVAWSVVRMEPTFAAKGEAAGFMAALVAQKKAGRMQDINYTTQLLPLLQSIGAKIT